ncbi:MAG: 3-octaprenyl-4-hydroxybenzoate carboxy-lyase, partial [Bacteroidetes bacterium]|nr:3-octaprenyl-4-hydroxybenzoate carboxy-lyase [Bacteroidota bacterium]
MRKILIAITGASGSIYAKNILAKLSEAKGDFEISVVLSSTANQVWQTELDEQFSCDGKFRIYDQNDFLAPFASGSGNYDTMIIIPCSMGTLGRIAGGSS